MVRLKVTVFCNISMMLLNASMLKVTKITAIFTALYHFPSGFFWSLMVLNLKVG